MAINKNAEIIDQCIKPNPLPKYLKKCLIGKLLHF